LDTTVQGKAFLGGRDLTFIKKFHIILPRIIMGRIIMDFYGRKSELALLGELTRRSEQFAQFTAIFGRRRVGKTELVRQHLGTVDNGLYFFVEKRPRQALLDEFSATLKTQLSHAPQFSNWRDFFTFLFAEARHRPLVVVFDEFQNFLSIDPAIYSILQNTWDEWHKQSPIHLIAIGSVVGLMKRVFQDAKEPLYGRLTRQIDLPPLPLETVYHLGTTLGFASPAERLTLYGLFGGMPRYYEMIESMDLGGKSVAEILRQTLFSTYAPFRHEVRDIILAEFGNASHTYLAILEAIATGKTRISEIAGPAGLPATSLSKYLRELADMFDLIEREVPITEKSWKTKKSHYKIKDPFITFWMRFIHRQLSLYESGNHRYFLDRLDTYLAEFMGLAFEDMVKELLQDLNSRNQAPIPFHQIGRWWNRQTEIDLVALNADIDSTLFAECKWTSSPVDSGVLHALKEKSKAVPTATEHSVYLLASRNGFSDRLKSKQNDQLLLWDLSEMDRLIQIP
jgi:uncharacterized protein